MRYFLICVIVCIVATEYATGRDATSIVLGDSTEYFLANRFELYLDSSGSLSLSQVVKKYMDGQFYEPHGGTIEPFKTYWLRFELCNNLSQI
jgi:hypothetical protein